MNIVQEAENFARCAHSGQFRRYSKAPYIRHVERVANRVAEYTNDYEVIAAAWLHDVVEDCAITLFEISKNFGGGVATLVWELTNPFVSCTIGMNRAERKKMDREHIAEGTKECHLVKVIDRIDNLNDMKGSDDDFKELYAKESRKLLDVLTEAPQDLKDELEHLIGEILNGSGQVGDIIRN